MNISTLISQHKDEIIGRWAQKVIERIGLEGAQSPQLINSLPDFLDELAASIDQPAESWRPGEGAVSHGRHRVEMGLDIGGLAEEFGLIAEAIFEVAAELQVTVAHDESALLARFIARGTAESVRAYAHLRDRQLADQASRNFSFIAHEIRTPLHAARLALQLIASGKGDRAVLLDRLQQSHDQLAHLVDNALVDARLQGEPHVQRSTHRTHELMRDAVGNAELLAVRRNIELRIEGDDIEVMVDHKVIVSALTNLVVNAVKFSCEDGVVTIRSRFADDRVLIEIDDACGGLPEDVPARLFQPFVQSGADRSGFGLGLMIVKQAVEAHGAAVRVVNLPPHGCRFVVELATTETAG